jgi:hypothetical protein
MPKSSNMKSAKLITEQHRSPAAEAGVFNPVEESKQLPSKEDGWDR